MDQQSFLQGYLPTIFAVLDVSTHNKFVPSAKSSISVLSGPLLVDQSNLESVICQGANVVFCSDPQTLLNQISEGCNCIDHTLYKIGFVHHGPTTC